MVLHFWETEDVPPEWEVGLLKILPKKGDRSLPGNYRGIMLLEVAYKIVANLLLARLTPIKEALPHEPQCGFRPRRGCTDASSPNFAPDATHDDGSCGAAVGGVAGRMRVERGETGAA